MFGKEFQSSGLKNVETSISLQDVLQGTIFSHSEIAPWIALDGLPLHLTDIYVRTLKARVGPGW